MILEPGQEIERYVVEGILGEGGMASVYRVRHQTLGSMYALKVLSIPSKSIRDRMLQEGRIQATMRAANVVQVVDVFDVGGMMGLLMEYIKGPSLAEFLAEQSFSLEEALAIFGGILEGVEVAHRKGLIHRDLKPANVLLHLADDGLWPKVTDFGIAKGGESAEPVDVTRPGTTMGTPAYMSPEQIQDASSVDQRADIWSLGCVLYELVCNRRAFAGDSILDILNAVVRGELVPPDDLVDGLPDRVLAAIKGSLVMDPSQRIPDCLTLASVLSGKSSASAVSDVLERHLPRTSPTVGLVRSMAFKTPPPVPKRTATTAGVTTADAPPPTAPPTASGYSITTGAGSNVDPLGSEASGSSTADDPKSGRKPITRSISLQDFDDGVERLSTEEVERFRVDARTKIKRHRSIHAYTPPPTFLGLPLHVAFGAGLAFSILIGLGVHYYRVINRITVLDAEFVAAADDRHRFDTGFEDVVSEGPAPTEPAEPSPAVAASAPPRTLVRPGPSGVDQMTDPEAESPAPNTEAEVAPPPPPPTTLPPRDDLPRKLWGKVKVSGDADRVMLLAADKQYAAYGKVPPGEYLIRAWFADDPIEAGRLSVRQESNLKLYCSEILQRCELR